MEHKTDPCIVDKAHATNRKLAYVQILMSNSYSRCGRLSKQMFVGGRFSDLQMSKEEDVCISLQGYIGKTYKVKECPMRK